MEARPSKDGVMPASAGFFSSVSCFFVFDLYNLSRALLHDMEAVMAAMNLSDDERSVCVRALGLLAASLRRSAKAAASEELRQIYERDASRVDALAVKFR